MERISFSVVIFLSSKMLDLILRGADTSFSSCSGDLVTNFIWGAGFRTVRPSCNFCITGGRVRWFAISLWIYCFWCQLRRRYCLVVKGIYSRLSKSRSLVFSKQCLDVGVCGKRSHFIPSYGDSRVLF